MIRGCSNLEHCGPHPGTPVVVIMAFACALAGGPSFAGMAFGFGVWVLLVLPLYLVGAYERSKLDLALSRGKRQRQKGSD